MSEHTSFWQRVGQALRGNDLMRRITGANGYSSHKPEQMHGGGPNLSAGATGVLDGLPTRPGNGLLRLGGGRASMEQLRDGYQRVLVMMDALTQHFDKQDRRAEELGAALNRLGEVLQHMAESQRSQGEHVSAIARQADAVGRPLSEALSRMPASLQAQTDAVLSLLRQLESSQSAESQLTDSLTRFGTAIESLNSASAAQVQTLQRMNEAQHNRETLLADLIRQQGRRYSYVVLAASVVIIGAAAGIAMLLMRH